MKNNTAGISLIEIMISVTVLAVGLLGVLQAFPRGLNVERNLELATIAEQLAQAKIEALAATAYNEIAVGLLENQIRVDADPASPLYDFKRSTQVEWLDANFNASGADLGLKKITVTIGWPATFDAAAHTTSLVYLKSLR